MQYRTADVDILCFAFLARTLLSQHVSLSEDRSKSSFVIFCLAWASASMPWQKIRRPGVSTTSCFVTGAREAKLWIREDRWWHCPTFNSLYLDAMSIRSRHLWSAVGDSQCPDCRHCRTPLPICGSCLCHPYYPSCAALSRVFLFSSADVQCMFTA